MIKEMVINIAVSGDTEQEANGKLIEVIDYISSQIQWSDAGKGDSGSLDEGEEEIHWSYEIKTINNE